MSSREDAEALFLEHLKWIDRVAARACGNHGIKGAEAEDFTARVRMALIEDDYGVVRRFDHESKFTTYLVTVIERHAINFQREVGGRWRTSAAAERLGPPLPELEKLVRRQGYTLAQAAEKLRTMGRTNLSDAELARLFSQLPERRPIRPLMDGSDAAMDAAPGESRADERIIEAEAGTRRAEILRALKAAMEELDPEDRMIVQLHLAEGRTLADVARTLRLDQKPLYRRLPRLRARLLALMESAGYHRDDVSGLLHEDEEP